MTFVDKLKTDVTEALKARDSLRTETLRGLLSSINNEEIVLRAKSKDLSDDDAIRVVNHEAKKRKEAIDLYVNAGREELADKEKDELKIIEEYLPSALSEDEVRTIVDNVVSTEGGDNFGVVMQTVMKEIAGRAEAKLVSDIVKEKTNS